MGSKHVLTLKGFDSLLERISEANGSIERATEKALTDGAKVLTNAFRTGAQQRGLPTDSLIDNPVPKWKGNRASIDTGFELDSYDSANPSSGYLVLFKEYGAPSKGGVRTTAKGYSRGRIEADPFIRPAVKSNAKAVKKAEENALNEILKELKS